jgi:deoxyribodipyrimidine photo-lyase
MKIIVWFRQDFRLDDNPALTAAAKKGEIIPVYIHAPEEEGDWPFGGATKWWLHHTLESLSLDLGTLIIRQGNTLKVLKELIKETNADAVYWNRRYEPAIIARDTQVKSELRDAGIEVHSFNANLLFEPWTVHNKQNKPFQVFTPFWKHCLTFPAPPEPLPVPKMHITAQKLTSEPLKNLKLLPKIHWDTGINAAWKPGAKHAKEVLDKFLKASVLEYADERDRPDRNGISHLSPYLHFGEISPRMIWHATLKKYQFADVEPYLRQLGWREFAHHLLYHFPKTPTKPLRPDFAAFPWIENPQALKSWQKGMTGYPIVDAGMRQLWTTGWMHNRVRMIVGSFLVKDLLISWQEGARWFWDTLVDADLANNTLGWQWVGGCGADAAPYFRIFNPITQGEKFDPDGAYVRKWVPELADLDTKWLHKPWEAPSDELRKAGITLGREYPQPIVDHKIARDRALAAFQKLRGSEINIT